MLRSQWYEGELHCRFAWSEVPPSIAVVQAIETYEDDTSDPADSPSDPLYHYLDTDALNALVRSDAPTRLEVELEDYHVHIAGNTVSVTANSSPHG